MSFFSLKNSLFGFDIWVASKHANNYLYNKSKYYPIDIFNLLKKSIQDNDPNKQLITGDAEKPIALKFNFEKEP